jgi:hypothetical protein
MKQTAVDWMYEQLWKNPKDKFMWSSIYDLAKQQEKLQIMESLLDGKDIGLGFSEDIKSEDYYKKTYEQK